MLLLQDQCKCRDSIPVQTLLIVLHVFFTCTSQIVVDFTLPCIHSFLVDMLLLMMMYNAMHISLVPRP